MIVCFRVSEDNIALPPWTLVSIGVASLFLLIVAVLCVVVRCVPRKSKPCSHKRIGAWSFALPSINRILRFLRFLDVTKIIQFSSYVKTLEIFFHYI